MTIIDELLLLWNSEACWICGQFGLCDHRELDVGAARLEALKRRALFLRLADVAGSRARYE